MLHLFILSKETCLYEWNESLCAFDVGVLRLIVHLYLADWRANV